MEFEDLFTIAIVLFVFWGVVRWIFRVIFGAGKAVAKTATGKGSFADNVKLEFKGFGPLEIRITEDRIGDDEETLILRIEGKGLIPVTRTTEIGFITSVFDQTDGDPVPVMTHVDMFQEPTSVAYQNRNDIGEVESNVGFTDWVQLGVVIPEILEPPKGGQRKLKILLRMIDVDNPPELFLGFGDGALWADELDYIHNHEGKGFEEKSSEQDEGRVLSLKIGMAVAMSDGSLDDTEGLILQDWVKKMITPYTEERQSELKELYNTAMRETHQQAKDGNLVLSEITERLNEIDNEAVKLDAIELAFQVMSADGVAEPQELETINRIAESLGIDYEEIEKFKDQNILKLDASVASEESMEALLDIDSDWDNEQINRHLRTLFQRWNGRLNSLDEGPEREQAQHMIDLIGKCQKKYADSA